MRLANLGNRPVLLDDGGAIDLVRASGGAFSTDFLEVYSRWEEVRAFAASMTSGNFSEYYSDMDCIVDDALWKAEDWTDSRALYSWGPPPPPSFIRPEDLAGLMASSYPAG